MSVAPDFAHTHMYTYIGHIAIDQSHKWHDARVPYRRMHHFMTEMCTCAHFGYKMVCFGIFVSCIVGFFRLDYFTCMAARTVVATDIKCLSHVFQQTWPSTDACQTDIRHFCLVLIRTDLTSIKSLMLRDLLRPFQVANAKADLARQHILRNIQRALT